jgi:hypothetical protein
MSRFVQSAMSRPISLNVAVTKANEKALAKAEKAGAAAPTPIAAGSPPALGDDTITCVAKFIPGEVLAFYLGLLAMIAGADPTQVDKKFAYVAVFFLGLGVTPLWFVVRRKGEAHWKRQTAVSTAAFLVWAYNSGGVFSATWSSWHNAFWGGVGLSAFTFFTALLRPK